MDHARSTRGERDCAVCASAADPGQVLSCNYVIKFKCNVTVNGEYLLEKYKEETLETRYKNKERK